ncbi:hypothetical protein D3C80_1801240 [compost metagenome]
MKEFACRKKVCRCGSNSIKLRGKAINWTFRVWMSLLCLNPMALSSPKESC